MDNQTAEQQYFASACAGCAELMDDKRALLIVSGEKSMPAYRALLSVALSAELPHWTGPLIGEDGQEHLHLFVAKVPNIIDLALDAIRKTKSGELKRGHLHEFLGALLGYPSDGCKEFSQSRVGRTCKCDCCGGPETAETDSNPGRFVQNAYQY